jgi:MFS transporter, DHA1 family, multidrug resistance protein
MVGGRLRRLTAGLPWPVISIGAVTFLVMMGFGLVPPALPLYAAHYELSNAQVALLLTSFSTGMLLFSFPGGMIADLLGFRRVALAGCVVAALGALAAATLPPFGALIAAQFAQGIGAALYMTAGIAAIVAQTPDDRVGRATATYQGIVLIGMSVAPALGGTAVQLLGLSGPFLVYAVAALVGLVVSAIVLPSAGRERADAPAAADAARTKDDPTRRVAVKQLLTSRAAIIALVVSFVTHWAVGGVRNTLVPLFGEAALEMSTVGIGWLLTGASVANVAVIRHAGQAIDAGRRAVTIWSLAGFALSVAIAAFAGAPWLLFVATLMIGATKGYAGVVPVAVITDVAHRSIYGSAIGFQRTATSLGLAIGPFTAGALADAFGFRTAFIVAACLLAAVALLAVLMPETATIDPSAKPRRLHRRLHRRRLRHPSTSPDVP